MGPMSAAPTPPAADGDQRPEARAALERQGRTLQWLTIAWNTGEVFVTVGLGIAARSLALIAFGLDSLVEVFASLVVVWHLQPSDAAEHDRRDRRALRLVSVAFAVLATYLLVGTVRSLLGDHEADSSPAGIAYLAITACVMFGLARRKRRLGTALDSEPFLAEASMTFLDGCLATSILVALAVNAALGWWWADPLAAGLVGLVAAREAVEQWREAG